jgi:hypothetical protein
MRAHDDAEVRDRETIRVSMMLCDHRPGFRTAHTHDMSDLRLDTMRRNARDQYVAGLQDAWKSPALGDAAVRDSRAVARTARADYIQRTCDAWKPRDAAQPDLGSTPEQLQRRQRSESDPADPDAAKTREREVETWLGRDPAELARDLESKRDAIHAERNASLANAWRTPTAGHQREGTGGGVAPGREWRLEHY